MAKDKSKTKGKSEKKAKGGGAAGDFAKPSEAPATGGDSWNFEDDANIGKLFLITPLREEEHKDTFSKDPTAMKKHIVADIVELNTKKPAKSEVHQDSWVFGGWTRGSLRGFIGERKVLGRLDRDPSKAKGSNVPWVLLDASDEDVEVAKAYLDSVDPFKQ